MAHERKFRQNLRHMNRRLRAYLADPENEKNIHDIRTSIRRLDAAFSLLPKKIRRRHLGKLEEYRQFLKASGKARDCDIIAGRIAAFADLDVSDLQKRKRAELARATALARSLKKLRPITPAAPDDERIEKVVSRLVERIGETLPEVLSDSSKVEELHEVRKSFRRLRYIFEMAPAGGRKKHLKNAAKVVGREVDLKELQALLGLIHDSDVTIEYLRGRPDATHILNKEIAVRRQLYKKFVRYMKE